jgi:hypothetical protein
MAFGLTGEGELHAMGVQAKGEILILPGFMAVKSASGLRHESCRSWEPVSFADLYGDGLFQCVQVQASLM